MVTTFSPTINTILFVKLPLCQAADYVDDMWQFSLNIYKSPIYKSTKSLLKSLVAFQSVVEPVFSSLSETSVIIGDIGNFTFSVISVASEKCKNVSTVFKIIRLPKCPKKIQKVFNQLKQALESGDDEQILDAELNAISLIGKCCEIPKTICKFLILTIGDYTPTIFHSFAKPFEKISVIFSVFSLVSEKRNLDSTTQLFEELKLSKCLKFIEVFNQSTQAHPVSFETIPMLSPIARVKRIKKIYAFDPRIEVITYMANKAFLKALDEKISQNPKNIKTYFNISKGDHLFALIQRENVQADPIKVKLAVKNIKLRLCDKIFNNKCSIFTEVCSISSAVYGIFVTFGVVCPPLSLITTAATCIASFVSASTTLSEHQRKKKFIKTIEEIASVKDKVKPEV